MTSEDPLLSPFQLRHLTLKNRIMSTSHTMLYAVDGAPQQRYQLYHEEKAKGGIAALKKSRRLAINYAQLLRTN